MSFTSRSSSQDPPLKVLRRHFGNRMGHHLDIVLREAALHLLLLLGCRLAKQLISRQTLVGIGHHNCRPSRPLGLGPWYSRASSNRRPWEWVVRNRGTHRVIIASKPSPCSTVLTPIITCTDLLQFEASLGTSQSWINKEASSKTIITFPAPDKRSHQ
jgi:hypothetical protein